MRPKENILNSFSGWPFEVVDDRKDKGMTQKRKKHSGCCLQENAEVLFVQRFVSLNRAVAHRDNRMKNLRLMIDIPRKTKNRSDHNQSETRTNANDT